MWMRIASFIAPVVGLLAATQTLAQPGPQVFDIPTRAGVEQRVLVVEPSAPKAVVLLFAGGHGGLQIGRFGYIGALAGNFLVRTRAQWAEKGIAAVVMDAPSDRQSAPFLGEFRQTAAHAEDIRASVAWARSRYQAPVWLVGTSRGSESVAYAATQLPGTTGPDGIVLTASVVGDKDYAITRLPLEQIRVPVLVAGHEQDACPHTAFADMAALPGRLTQAPRKELIGFTGGTSRGDPCQAASHHGFGGIEAQVIDTMARWILL